MNSFSTQGQHSGTNQLSSRVDNSVAGVVLAAASQLETETTKKHGIPLVGGCPVCGNGETFAFFESENFPVHVCVLHDSQQDALKTKTGNVRLHFCGNCEFVFNDGFDNGILDFQPGYDASLTFSPTFRKFSEEVADRLVHRYDLNQKNIIEVGCGEGYFLGLLAKKGGNSCYGFDPTIKDPKTISAGGGTVTSIRDYYDSKYTHIPCDFLCCLSVMEDLQQPGDFVKGITELLGDRTVNCYFEIFNGMRAIENLHTWSILYEQCSYFSVQSYTRLFRQNGFEILDSGTCYQDGEYLYVEARWNGGNYLSGQSLNGSSQLEKDSIATTPGFATSGELVQKFQKSRESEISRWNEILNEYHQQGKKGVVWGTGGKGVSFLNALKDHPALQCAIDINPRRSGKFVPGSGHQILTPDSMTQWTPAFVVVTNPLYEDEIRLTVSDLGIDCDFYTT